jgi:DNA glycosylase AlkZ-like
VQRIDVAERRARLARRHHLALEARASDPVEVARDLVGVHSSDPASVYLEFRARLPDFRPEHLDDALYQRRALVRLLGMRRTMFVAAVEDARLIHAACTRTYAARERQRFLGMLVEAGIAADPEPWLADVEARTLEALRARGQAVATELSADVPELRAQIPFGQGKRWAGTMGVSTRVLLLLAVEGRVVRARPRGSWLSSQYRWAPAEDWLPGGLDGLPTHASRTELARRWLAAFGPATAADLRWWAGWTLAEARRALDEVGAREVALDDGSGYLLPDDLEPTPEPAPWVALLPALDATVMGWAGRAWYLGAHGPALFDRNGNAGPTVWCDGRVVGGWGQRADGAIAYRLLEDPGREAEAALAAEADKLAAWMGASRPTPRFRTPLEVELLG